jgi:hypothetical protein
MLETFQKVRQIWEEMKGKRVGKVRARLCGCITVVGELNQQ